MIFNLYQIYQEQPQDIYKDDEYPLDCSEVQLDPAWRPSGVGDHSEGEGGFSLFSSQVGKLLEIYL